MSNNANIVSEKDINTNLPREFILMCFASFEERSTSIPLALDSDRISSCVVFKSLNTNNEDALSKICQKIPRNQVTSLDLNDPISTAQSLTEVVRNIPSTAKFPLVIDITTFTHETLAMLMKLVYDNKQKFESIFCLYTGASDYCDSKKDGLNQMWLSKGCCNVRNIVGYPGRLRPVSKTCLIILTGFELERATKLIEFLEPDKLAIGCGTEAIHNNNESAMTFFRKKFKEWKENYKNSNCIEFDFSCKDIEKTVNILDELITSNPDDNYIIVPLNTKLSTIASLIVSLQNPKVQVCYAIPEIYNTQNYSTPGENITIVELSKISIFKIN